MGNKLSYNEIVTWLIEDLEYLSDVYMEPGVIYNLDMVGLFSFDAFSYEYISQNEIKCHFYRDGEEIKLSASDALGELYED